MILGLVIYKAFAPHFPTDPYMMILLLVIPMAFAGHIPSDPLVDGPITVAPLRPVLVKLRLAPI